LTQLEKLVAVFKMNNTFLQHLEQPQRLNVLTNAAWCYACPSDLREG